MIFSEIFCYPTGDVTLHRVKFDANQEFQYIQNYKALQMAFDKHRIENVTLHAAAFYVIFRPFQLSV